VDRVILPKQLIATNLFLDFYNLVESRIGRGSAEVRGNRLRNMVRRVVRLLTTGGTIASRRMPDGEVLASVSANDLTAEVVFDGDVEVQVEEVFVIGSYQLRMEDLLHLAKRVQAAFQDPNVVGVVVTHGTDTMEESAYFVDLFHAGPQPVVFTGAQRPNDSAEPDGVANLQNAVRLAASPGAQGLGVLVAMASQAYVARDATKIFTMELSAFGAPGRGPTVEMYKGAPMLVVPQARRPHFELAAVSKLPRVEIIPMYVGVDGSLVDAACAAGAVGLVLQAFGIGNTNELVLKSVKAAIASQVLVIVASRCSSGPVRPLYGAGGGADLKAAGAIFAGDLRPLKARLLLMVALSTTTSHAQALAMIAPHLAE
jgi:L-asparaginase